MKSGRSLVSLAQELERQLNSKKDLIVPSTLVRHATDDPGRDPSRDRGRRRPGALQRHTRWRAANWRTS
jgi:hypothetical protein